MKYSVHFKWLLIVSIFVFAVALLVGKGGLAQLKRDEETAKEAKKVNPLTPVAKVTGTILDNTVNKVLPFELSTESQYVKHETECYESCERTKKEGLEKATTDFDRGRLWSDYQKCKEACPRQAAQKTESETRAPAGSAIEGLKSR